MTALTDNQAYQRGVRDCISWLHRRADEMNDPHAKAVLNSAAFSLGVGKPTNSAPTAIPVAWRVKDFADGWILFHTEDEARRLAALAGNLVEALYASPASPAQRQRHPRETQ